MARVSGGWEKGLSAREAETIRLLRGEFEQEMREGHVTPPASPLIL